MEEDKKQRHQVGDIALKVQHLAAAYGIGRYITFPSIKFGENLDNAAYAVMQTVDQVKDIAQYVEDTVQKIALKLGAEVRAGHSMLEDIATQMEYDIQSEMQTNTDSSLQEQLSTLKEFRTQLDVYFNSSEQTLQDITHTLRQSAIKTADVTDQIKPESGPINYLTEIKEKLFGKLGAPTGEVHRIDQASAEQEYADLLKLTGDIERALTQVSERYQGSKKDFAAREAWISKSNELIDNYFKIADTKENIDGFKPGSSDFRDELSTIVDVSDDITKYMKKEGYDITEPFAFMSYALPVIATLTVAVLYNKAVKIEKDIAGVASKSIKTIKRLYQK